MGIEWAIPITLTVIALAVMYWNLEHDTAPDDDPLWLLMVGLVNGGVVLLAAVPILIVWVIFFAVKYFTG